MARRDLVPLMIGKTIKEVYGLNVGSSCVTFVFTDGNIVEMTHCQECCEEVYLEDFDNDESIFKDAILHEFYEMVPDDPKESIAEPRNQDEACWTFYKIRTSKGWITITWFGESNGCYRTEADVLHKFDLDPTYNLFIEYRDSANMLRCKSVKTKIFPKTHEHMRHLIAENFATIIRCDNHSTIDD